MDAIEDSNYKPGEDIFIGLDIAASEFYSNKKYNLSGESLSLDSDGLIKYYGELIKSYPIISIEDALDENDWEGWKMMTSEIGDKCQLVGDDLFVTSIDRLKKGIEQKMWKFYFN